MDLRLLVLDAVAHVRGLVHVVSSSGRHRHVALSPLFFDDFVEDVSFSFVATLDI